MSNSIIISSQPAILQHSRFFNENDNESVGVHDRPDIDVDPSYLTQNFKTSGACVECKSVKVRCEFVRDERVCQRCQARNLPCRPRERKKRKVADTHEQLQERSHEQDLHIQNLLLQYDQRRAEQKVHEWVSKASSSKHDHLDSHQRLKTTGQSPELAAISYFSTGPAPQQLVPPAIVKHCSLYPGDIQELFSIFFTYVNPYFSILDQEYHTPERLIWKSPFLFTVLCAVASRYYIARPNLYSLAMEFARDCAGIALVEGDQSIEVCQAYLLMAVYPVPKKKWIEDRSWLLTGVAIRMAIELKLNQPPPASCEEREALNRTRTWLNCYCVDGFHAIQYGKIPMLQLDDYISRHSRDWYKSSPLNAPFDVHLCAYVQMIIHMAVWGEYTKMNTAKLDDQPDGIVDVAIRTQEVLSREMDVWANKYTEEYEFLSAHPIGNYCVHMGQMIAAYLGLVVLVVGFQKTQPEDLHPDSEILVKCIDAARSAIQIVLERLYPSGYLSYALEANFLYASFAAAFLINLFRPRFIFLLSRSMQQEIIITVSSLIIVLEDVALDGRHTPALYSRFLASLMEKHDLNLRNTNSLINDDSGSQNFHTLDRHHTPPEFYHWPDVPQYIANSSTGHGYQAPQENGMDFSLPHFIRSVTQRTPSSPLGPDEMDASDSWET